MTVSDKEIDRIKKKGILMQKTKKVIAIIGIVFLVGSYLSTLIASLMHSEFAHGLFIASMFCSIAVPLVLYGYMLIYKYFSSRDKEEE